MSRICSAAKGAFFGSFGLSVLTAVWWLSVQSSPFLKSAWTTTNVGTSDGILFIVFLWLAFFLLYTALVNLLSSVLGGKALRATLVILSLIGAGAFAFTTLYGTVMDPSMMRNVFATDAHEAMDLFSAGLVTYFLAAAVPPVLLALFWPIKKLSLKRSLLGILLSLVLTALAAGVTIANFQDFSFFLRGQKDSRYYLAPLNLVYSTAKAFSKGKTSDSITVRSVVDPNPKLSSAVKAAKKPLLLVVVVGETARSANWGLSGYERDTTPELRSLGVVNFRNTTSCGTNTETSVPCMFSRIGRRNYSESLVHSEEPLPDVLKRAGVNTLWIENQSGCKGVCTNIPTLDTSKVLSDEVKKNDCPDGRCRDEVMLPLFSKLEMKPGTSNVLFLHMMGSHGPAYTKRYPKEFEKWRPVCDSSDLKSCSPEQVRNSYDNSILYTDHVLAESIRRLQNMTGSADVALLYVSDHGESLGEKGLYLHGAPWMIAPKEQTQVPMIFWASEGYMQRTCLSKNCLEKAAAGESSHDYLWSTILRLAGVGSSTYDSKLDLFANCSR